MVNNLAPVGYAPNELSPAETLHRAIVGQESGWNPNIGASAKGAHGIGQIMPGTFKQYARAGESIDKPEDNLAVSRRIIDDYYKRYGGDSARAAVAYFSGPGNVSPAGSPTPWKKDLSDGRVLTSQYVQQVQDRIGKGTGVPAKEPMQLPGVTLSEAPSPAPTLSGEANLAQAQMLAVLSAMLPKHKFTPIDYDPFAVIGGEQQKAAEG